MLRAMYDRTSARRGIPREGARFTKPLHTGLLRPGFPAGCKLAIAFDADGNANYLILIAWNTFLWLVVREPCQRFGETGSRIGVDYTHGVCSRLIPLWMMTYHGFHRRRGVRIRWSLAVGIATITPKFGVMP